MAVLKVGFVGVGGMGQCAHLANYSTICECNVVAIAEIREGLGKEVAQRYGVPHTYTDHREMLEKESLDAIVASQPFTRHGVLLPDLFEAGVPVFTEKPLAGSVETGEKILHALKSSRASHFVGYHKRSDPATMWVKREMRRWADDDEMGALRYVRILIPAGDWVANGMQRLITSDEPVPVLEHDPQPSDMDEDTRQEYFSLVNYYIHQINLMRHLLGRDYTLEYADPNGLVMTMTTRTGVTGTIEMSPYHTSVDWEEEALVAYERGYMKLKLPAPLAWNRAGQVEVYRDPDVDVDPVRLEPVLPWVHAMRQQALNFLHAVEGQRATPLCTAEEALKDLQVAREYIRLLRGV